LQVAKCVERVKIAQELQLGMVSGQVLQQLLSSKALLFDPFFVCPLQTLCRLNERAP
jgi:hypothetical protein